MSGPGPGRATTRDQRGAAAVEFGLVCPLFLLLLLGILQYGLFFNDYLQARSGVRQAARAAIVQTTPTCTGASTDADRIRCYARTQIQPVSGTPSVRVATPSGWTKGQPLLVCAVMKSGGVGGLIPMPSHGYVRAKTYMAIEQSTPAPSGTFPSSDTDPSGDNWSWCQ